MPHVQSTPKNPEQSGQFAYVVVRLKDLEVELQLHNDLETKKLEFCLRKLELVLASQAAKKSTDLQEHALNSSC